MESRIRDKVKAVVRCDILSDDVLRIEELPTDARPPYDLIISILCLEVPCANFDDFVTVLKRVNTLLKKGGGLIIASVYNVAEWYVGKNAFPNLRIDLKDIIVALDKAGFGNHDVKKFSPVKLDYPMEYAGYYCIATEKL
ncbi:hypothetical protein CEXT_203511 [Caerostris extrusa]|uniref:Uncharacterized protein n=1 Tax=Caerostris extrusa TaxID=172846 RepID=A0AAV4WJ32_CAEEX|nr:hypothetical protein CEXT_203511 [Caerostris extrusa]